MSLIFIYSVPNEPLLLLESQSKQLKKVTGDPNFQRYCWKVISL